jgi:hypothetical protein
LHIFPSFLCPFSPPYFGLERTWLQPWLLDAHSAAFHCS